MYVSIMGDSISTYEGFNPPDYAVYYNKTNCQKNGLNSVYDTWWAKVNQFLKAYLCVNNSYSGSRVAGLGVSAGCSTHRTSTLHNNSSSPDIILVYLGINDFANGVILQGKDYTCFEQAYDTMLSQLKSHYPRAWIVCGTLMQGRVKANPSWCFPSRNHAFFLEEYNDTIRRVCKKQQCVLADLAALNKKYETLDGAHPTAYGHTEIAQCWISCLKK